MCNAEEKRETDQSKTFGVKHESDSYKDKPHAMTLTPFGNHLLEININQNGEEHAWLVPTVCISAALDSVRNFQGDRLYGEYFNKQSEA